jgi:hypothetical protein
LPCTPESALSTTSNADGDVQISSELVDDQPQTSKFLAAEGSQTTSGASGGFTAGSSVGNQSFWDKTQPWFDFGFKVLEGFGQYKQQQQAQAYARYLAQQNALAAQRMQQAQQLLLQAQQNNRVNSKSIKAPTGTPTTPTSPGPKPPPTSTQPPTQNCSQGVCCIPPQIPNPAAIACLNAPLFINGEPNGCDHPNGPTSWLAWCIAP